MHQLTILITIVLFTAANLLTSYFYLYPIFHGCGFPVPPPPPPTQDGSRLHSQQQQQQLLNQRAPTAKKENQGAPFRLLLLADPQLEGSTSLPPDEYSYFPSLLTLPSALSNAAPLLRNKYNNNDKNNNNPPKQSQWQILQTHTLTFYHTDLPVFLRAARKRLDLLGNDFYLAHIYRSLQTFTAPTHTAVLGDLLGSQWIDSAEFEARAERYWGRVFAGGGVVGGNITDITGSGAGGEMGMRTQRLGDNEADAEYWRNRVINVAGNHDIGYAGDMTVERVWRFEKAFGAVNWVARFTLPPVVGAGTGASTPELRLVVLNSLNIDGPVLDPELQRETLEFMDRMKTKGTPLDTPPREDGKKIDGTSATILLTHLPLHKEAGVCVDAPMIRYAEEEDSNGVIREQNHLSYGSSTQLLDTFFGLNTEEQNDPNSIPQEKLRHGRGIIFTGHDHEGCDTYHSSSSSSSSSSSTNAKWTTSRYNSSHLSSARTGIREITLRSMMGTYSGNAGFLSAWFDPEQGVWEFGFEKCELGREHIWWGVHVLDLVTVGMCIYTGVGLVVEALRGGGGEGKGKVGEEKKRQ